MTIGNSVIIHRLIRLALVPAVLLALAGCQARPAPEPAKSAEEIRLESLFPHTISFVGETLGIIAKWYTGDTNNWKVIVESNPGLDPKRLKIGQVIMIPRSIMVREDPLTKKAVGGGTAKAGSSATKQPMKTAAESPAVVPSKSESPTTDIAAAQPAVAAATEEPVTPEAVGQAPKAEPARSRDELLKELLEEF